MVNATIHNIFIIESIPDDERQTGMELYNDVIKPYSVFHKNNTPLNHTHVKVKSKKDFIEYLKYLESVVPNMNLGLLIHIESHGSKEGIHFANEEMISWQELKGYLISLNFIADNKLYVSMANCFGRFLYHTIDTSENAPFCAFLSANKVIDPSEIVDFYNPFFDNLIKERDFILAYKACENYESKFYYKDVELLLDETLMNWEQEMKSNLETKNEFYENIRKDYNKLRLLKPSLPDFTDDQLDSVLEEVKKDLIVSYKNDFLFGKGRLGIAVRTD